MRLSRRQFARPVCITRSSGGLPMVEANSSGTIKQLAHRGARKDGRGRPMTTATGVRSADRNSVLATLGDYIREISNPDDLAYASAELLGRSLNVSRAGYGTVDTSAETITIVRDWNAPGILSLAGVLRFRDYGS